MDNFVTKKNYSPEWFRIWAIFGPALWFVGSWTAWKTTMGSIISSNVTNSVTTWRWTLNQLFTILTPRWARWKRDITAIKWQAVKSNQMNWVLWNQVFNDFYRVSQGKLGFLNQLWEIEIWKSQFYIQLVYRPHFGTWILLFGPFGLCWQ